MKKTSFVILLAISSIFLIACKITDKNNYNVNEKEYTLYNAEGKSFVVKYLQVSDMDDKDLENKINQATKSSVSEWVNQDCEWMADSKLIVECHSSKYLSYYYEVESKDERGKDYLSTFARIGITINIETGERIYANDLINDIASFKNKLVEYSYENEVSCPIDTQEVEKIIYYTSISEKEYLEEILINDPLVYESIFSYIRIKPTFYLTDKYLVITRDENKYNDILIDFSS